MSSMNRKRPPSNPSSKPQTARGSRFALILGEDEVAANTLIVLKNLNTKEQVTLSSTESEAVIQYLQ